MQFVRAVSTRRKNVGRRGDLDEPSQVAYAYNAQRSASSDSHTP
jgi:hypothetical protein